MVVAKQPIVQYVTYETDPECTRSWPCSSHMFSGARKYEGCETYTLNFYNVLALGEFAI